MGSVSSLSVRLARALIRAVLVALALFFVLQLLGSRAVDCYVRDTDYLDRCAAARLQSLRSYIDEHDVSSVDAAVLRAWSQTQPLVLFELYRDGRLVFSSSNVTEDELYDKEIEARPYDWFQYYVLDMEDGQAEALIISDDAYQLRMNALIAESVMCFVAFFTVFLMEVRRIERYIRLLSSEIQVMAGGVFERPVTIQGKDELGTLANNLESLRTSFAQQRAAEESARQANQLLVTSLSHDLRTPLTKLLLYTEIVRRGGCGDEERLSVYLGRIDEVAEQIKSLADSILRYSSASDGEGKLPCEEATLEEALADGIGEMSDYCERQGLQVWFPPSVPECTVLVFRPFVRRVFDNVTSNLDRYADRSQPVLIECFENEEHAGITVTNVVAAERDVADSTGIGTRNIASMMEAMGGLSQTSCDGEAFETTLSFRKVRDRDARVLPPIDSCEVRSEGHEHDQ